MNAVNNLSFYVHKITRNQIDIFSSGGPMLGCMSYCFLAEYHTLRIYTSTKGNCNCHVCTLYDYTNKSWFVNQTGYWILMNGYMNLETYDLNLKRVKQKQWEWQRE